MRTFFILSALGLALAAVSCGENDPSSATSGNTKKTLLVPSGASEQSGAASAAVTAAQGDGAQRTIITGGPGAAQTALGQAPAAAERSRPLPQNVAFADVPPAPSNAQWTIFCTVIRGPAHVEQSRDMKQRLMQLPGLKDWYIVHGADDSTLYYGFYRSINDPNDPKESNRAQTDRRRLNAWKDLSGERPFAHSMFVELTTPNPEAPPEWDLTHAPDWAAYTVQVAAEKNTPDRKKNAVEIVRKLREKGVEAYYFHGPSTSSVCIGLWPSTAIKQPVIVDPVKGIKSVSPTQDIVVVDPNLPQATNNMVNEKGERMLVAQPKPVIVDERMIATMREYSDEVINGEVMVEAKTKKTFEHSFVVALPDRTLNMLATGNTDRGSGGLTTGISGDPFGPSEATAPARPTGGRLKSLDH